MFKSLISVVVLISGAVILYPSNNVAKEMSVANSQLDTKTIKTKTEFNKQFDAKIKKELIDNQVDSMNIINQYHIGACLSYEEITTAEVRSERCYKEITKKNYKKCSTGRANNEYECMWYSSVLKEGK